MSIDLSIVVVNWNVRDLLRRCLASIYKSSMARLEVIVVDNASSDGSAEMVRTAFPAAMLLSNADNVGFPAGNNQGFAAARGRYVMTLNPDTEIVGDALAEMTAYLDAHRDVGALGPQLLNSDGSVQSSRRRFPTFATALFESTWLQGIAPRGVLARYYMDDRLADVAQEVDWVTGACILVRRDVLASVGGFDEAFFMYSEELDWCRRIKLAGWKIVYLPEAKVIHHVGRSSGQAVAARHVHFQTSKVRYFKKHHGRFAGGMLRVFLLALYAWQMLLESVKMLLGHKREMRRQRVRVYWQVVRSRLR
ncbi:MAG TPA: glycosyltransferase family 2 protein [Anaerolineae bacterium]|nr:glycosyltransferase family 2 protein [Anaerolineae bacterium]